MTIDKIVNKETAKRMRELWSELKSKELHRKLEGEKESR